MADHIASIFKKQREMSSVNQPASSLSFLFMLEPHSIECCHPHSGCTFPLQATSLMKTLLQTYQMCLLGDSKFGQVDNEDKLSHNSPVQKMIYISDIYFIKYSI